jgi:1-acyl-sn-glycerol-3-phosphate acyltransferase
MSWQPPITLRTLDGVDPVIRRSVAATVAFGASIVYRLGGVRVVFEHPEHMGDAPSVIMMNHSHLYDWLPVRLGMFREYGRMCANLVKPLPYQQTLQGHFLHATGNVPIASRGYVLIADFRLLHGRKPTEPEYRNLRDRIDGRGELRGEATPEVERALTEPRDMLGRAFDPAAESYADAVQDVFRRFAVRTAELADNAMRQRSWLLITPQGVVNSRLTPARIGALQFASHLDRPIVPCGVSGVREAFPGGILKPAGGTITVRFGRPFRFRLPDDHRIFEKASEDRNRALLEAEGMRMMQRINDLLDPQYQWDEDPDGDGLKGVARFI